MFSTTHNTLQLIRRNKDTLEVTEVVDTKNTLTLLGENAASEGNLRPVVSAFGVSELKTAADVPVIGAINSNKWKRNDSTNNDWQEVVVGQRVFWESSRRFNAPASGTSRPINTIILTNASADTAPASVFAYASLDSTFTQADTDILDIVYRIEFIGNFTNGSNFTTSSDIKKNVANANMRSGDHSDNHRIAYAATRGDGGSKLVSLKGGTVATQTMTDASTVFSPPHYEYFYNELTATDWVGQLLKSYIVSDKGNSANGAYVWGNLFDSGFPHKPVQVIHNHSATAINPFLDVNHLASGSGTLAVDGTNWNLNTPFCDWYYISIDKGGATGSAQYTFSTRRGIAGFGTDGSYKGNSSNTLPWFSDANRPQLKWTNYTFDDWITFPWVTAYESDGVSLINLDTGVYKTWSATSETRIQQFTEIWQITTDDVGNIWVADRAQGLYKISDPTGTGTIQKMTTTTNGIPSNGGCYGVCEGHNGKVWAVFDGGICSTDNKGTSWTTYGPEYLNYADSIEHGSTVSPHLNQSRIIKIYCDIEAPDDRLSLVIDRRDRDPTEPVASLWWSPTGNCTMKDMLFAETSWGGSSSLITVTDSAGKDIPQARLGFVPSRSGGLWACSRLRTSFSYLYLHHWGTDRIRSTANQGTASDFRNTVFWYDINGEPAVEAGFSKNATSDTATQSRRCVLSANGDYVHTRRNNVGNTMATFDRWQVSNQAKLALVESSGSLRLISPDMVGNDSYASNVPADSFGGRHTKGRDYSVFDYRWNPTSSAFELNYQHPCKDIAATPTDVPRSGFDTQSHVFTGNSSVDVTQLLSKGLTDDAMTMCATIKPAPVEHFNGTLQTLLSLDTYGIYRDTLGEVQSNGIYWNQRQFGRYAQESAASTLHSLSTTRDEYYKPTVTVHTAGPADNLTQGIRMVATLKREAQQPRPMLLASNAKVKSTHVYDPATRSISWRDDSDAVGGGLYVNVAPNVAKQYTDFSFRYRLGDDFGPSTGLQDDHYLKFSLNYSAGHRAPNAQLSQLADESRYVMSYLKADGPTGAQSYTRESGQNLTTADKDGTNLLDLRFFTVDNGANWSFELRRVNNPGASETFTVIYTATAPFRTYPEHGYNPGGAKVASFLMYFEIGRAGNSGQMKQYYKDLDVRDNTTNTSLWDSMVTYSKFTGKVYLSDTLHSTSTWYELDAYRNRATTNNPMADFAFGSESRRRKMTVGAQKFITSHYYYRGVMENVQFWKVALDAADRTADFTATASDATAKTATKPATDLIGHYPMVEDLDGKESRVTHAASAVFDNALALTFTDGATAPAWAATDFYTFGVTDGVLKDNATAFNLRKDLFTKPTNPTWNYVESSAVSPGTLATQVPAVSTNVFWEPVTFVGTHISGTTHAPRYQVPGMIGCYNGIDNTSQNTSTHRRSLELLRGDGEFQFRPATDENTQSLVHFSGKPTTLTARTLTAVEIQQSFYFDFSQTKGEFDVYALGNQAVSNRAYAVGDLFRVVRVGAQYTLYHNTDVLITFDPTGYIPWNPTGEMMMSMSFTNTAAHHAAWYDVKLKTSKPRPELQLGNISSQLGRYATNYATFAWQPKFWEFNLNGGPPSKVNWYTPSTDDLRAIFSIPDPAPGEITVLPYHGVIIFNTADVGKSFQVNCVLVERK